jgi:urease subunit gamma
VAELMSFGTTILGREAVMEGVAEMIHEVQWKRPFRRDEAGHRAQSIR